MLEIQGTRTKLKSERRNQIHVRKTTNKATLTVNSSEEE
jgi:hypothetical protein